MTPDAVAKFLKEHQGHEHITVKCAGGYFLHGVTLPFLNEKNYLARKWKQKKLILVPIGNLSLIRNGGTNNSPWYLRFPKEDRFSRARKIRLINLS